MSSIKRDVKKKTSTPTSYALQANAAKAKSAYQDILGFWKDADPDLPTVKQVKAEHAKLQ